MSAPHEPRDGDPFELLAGLVDRDERPLEPGDDPHADALLARLVVAAPAVALTHRRRRRVVAAAAVIAVVGAGSAVAAVWSRQPADAVSLRCYSEATAEPRVEVGLVAAPDIAPVDQCAAAWLDGSIARTGAPELVACVDGLDATVVVPGGPDTCGVLGWVPAADPDPAARVDAAVVREVADVLGECEPDPAAAVAKVQAVFDGLGADAWTVSPPVDPAGGCVVPVPDAASRNIELVAIPVAG